MNQRIIYPTPDGIAILIPSKDIDINEVARKDVPDGVPYLMIDAADVPSDRVFRDAWGADFTSPDGFGIGADAWFAEKAAAVAQPQEVLE